MEDIRPATLKVALQHVMSHPVPQGSADRYFHDTLHFSNEANNAMLAFLQVIRLTEDMSESRPPDGALLPQL
ncbi:hypothetical protein [Nocardia brasiliensis]|uniref:hypothetical protein n=1 Tax=Nocardia brasiliensis TaxID=37326 RepID=UPI002454A079|nr:hypothetical protein [Nocardia brasiliensis]